MAPPDKGITTCRQPPVQPLPALASAMGLVHSRARHPMSFQGRHALFCYNQVLSYTEYSWTAAQEPEAAKPAEEEKKVEETNGKSDVKPEAPKEAPKGIPALAPRKKKAATAEAAKQAEA